MTSETRTTTFTFPNTPAAEQALTEVGFSYGTRQRDDPRGILFGDFIIAKWRNLTALEKIDLDGRMTRVRPGPDSPVSVVINRPVPAEALVKLKTLAVGAY